MFVIHFFHHNLLIFKYFYPHICDVCHYKSNISQQIPIVYQIY
jgi:hypothetical protein